MKIAALASFAALLAFIVPAGPSHAQGYNGNSITIPLPNGAFGGHQQQAQAPDRGRYCADLRERADQLRYEADNARFRDDRRHAEDRLQDTRDRLRRDCY
jgi:hypothetical protein